MGGESNLAARPKSTYPTLSAKPVGALIPNIYKERIQQFYSPGAGGQYVSQNLLAYAILSHYHHIIMLIYSTA